MKKFVFFFFFITNSFSQSNVYKYHVYLYNSGDVPPFSNVNGVYKYVGTDNTLKTFFANYSITYFEALYKFDKEYFKRILYLETSSSTLANNLIRTYPSIYEKIVNVTESQPNELTSYPNDYGATNPNPPSTQYPGYQIERSDLDYMEVNRAWDITTGISLENGLPVKIGISDTKVNSTDIDFVGKVTYYDGVQNYDQNHGTNSGGLAAAKGNNGYGSTGVCYDCSIENTLYDTSMQGYPRLVNLALQSKARVINMSWSAMYSSSAGDPGTFAVNQAAINELANTYRVVLVASAGNQSSYQTIRDWYCEGGNSSGPNYTGMRYGFPASFDNVISVSSVNHKYQYTLPLSTSQNSYCCTSPTGINCYGLQGSIGTVNGNNVSNPVGVFYNGYPEYCNIGTSNQYISSPNGIASARHTTNPQVDILAPTWDTFQFNHFTLNNGAIVYSGGGTSGSAPRVTGTVALMIAVNGCLYPKDVDAILKLTSHDVENLSFNQLFAGNIGAGALNTGSAVVFVNEMKKTNGIALLQNHIFNRFDFKLDKINNKLHIDNITFKDNCRAEFTARNQIRVLPGTRFAPNANGKVRLSLNSSMDIGCPPIVYPPSSRESKNNEIENRYKLILSPNPNNGSFNLYNINFDTFQSNNLSVRVLDLNGRNIFEKNISKNDDTFFDIQNLTNGVYIVKISSSTHTEDLKFIKK